MKKENVKKIALCGILTALAVISFTIESLFPPLIIPGARMGISNIFILFAIICLGYKYGLAVMIIKVILGSLFSGNVSSLIYSLPAGLISCIIEILFIERFEKFSIVSISVLGSVLNVSTQNFIFCLVTNTMEYLRYLPYLVCIGAVTGLIVGFTLYLLIKKIPL